MQQNFDQKNAPKRREDNSFLRVDVRALRAFVALLIAVSILIGSSRSFAATDQPETKEQRDARMKWWREARFGMFIHWGVYSVPAGVWKGQKIESLGEWIMHNAKIPVDDYAALTLQFNPVKFNAEQWVQAAKNAGMKYIVITSKHHDGFAMFHTAVDGYNIYDATPFHRDPLAELAAACKKYDMKLGFYYSQAQDWHHPGGAALKGGHWDPKQDGSFDDYLKNVALPQVKEILSNYGPVSVLWWDTPADMTKERAQLFLPLLKLQPDIITNNRLVQKVPEISGDTETPEQFIPATGFPGRDWETCMTMNDTWGYKSWDNNWKPSTQLIRNLIDIASKGGNYLLNVGPTSEGVMPGPSLERLKDIGDWMKVNGEAIYGTSATPFRKNTFDGRATIKDDRIFLHVFSWPKDGIKVLGIQSPVKSVLALSTNNPVDFKQETNAGAAAVLTIQPPGKIDPVATVIALEFASPPQIDISATAVHAGAGGEIGLNASGATIDGRKLELNDRGDQLISWSNVHDGAMWDLVAKMSGRFQVTITYSCPTDSAGSSFNIKVGDSTLAGKTIASNGDNQLRTDVIGTLSIGDGLQTLSIKPTKLAKDELMRLQKITLTPIH